MKPNCSVARRGDYEIRDCPLYEAAALIRAEHYARGCSNTAVYRHGLYRNGNLVGAALWLPPTKACAQTVHPKWERVLSLSRLALRQSEPQNAESILIGASIRMIRRERKWAALVTFSDLSQGHKGVIYRATNWTHVGLTRPEPRWEDGDGRQVSRLATKSRTRSQMEALGYRMVGKFSKHKYTMVLQPTRGTMKYLNGKFSVCSPGSAAYRDNWENIFSKSLEKGAAQSQEAQDSSADSHGTDTSGLSNPSRTAVGDTGWSDGVRSSST